VTNKQCDEVIEAFKDNGALRGSYGFNGSKPTFYGEGLLPHLQRWTGRQYIITGQRIEPDDTL
jgi:hypothetical protein